MTAHIVSSEVGGFLSSLLFVTERKKPAVGGENHHPAAGERGPPCPRPQPDGCVQVAAPTPLLPSPPLFL